MYTQNPLKGEKMDVMLPKRCGAFFTFCFIVAAKNISHLVASVIADAVGVLGHERVEQGRVLHHHFLRVEGMLAASPLYRVRRQSPRSSDKPDQGCLAFRLCFQGLLKPYNTIEC